MKRLICALLAFSFAFAEDAKEDDKAVRMLAALKYAYADGGAFFYELGDLEFVAIKDADTNNGKEILENPDAPIVKKTLPDNQNPSTINVFLVRAKTAQTKMPTVLVDTGLGKEIFDNLDAIGVAPEAIDIVAITHMHGDHIGGLTKNGKPVFASARVLLPKRDLEYWLGSGEENKKAAQALQKAYGARLSTFEWGDKIAPNILAIKAEGHTPGHTAYEIESNGEKLLIVSDLIHSLKTQMADPAQSVIYDVDPVLAASTRLKLLNYAANADITIAGMHIRFPGIGKVVKDKNAFRFKPIN
ncbi:MAG: MBL fold metallo-hydrolase [Helicobacteraceae bacterium]|jgi:glyoxylase-like metal-dependent hydrolase (beta-lactamase superfamily II)|nr:MBL fold metallo-hydrolase [Helicobacteraceae bacterium]